MPADKRIPDSELASDLGLSYRQISDSISLLKNELEAMGSLPTVNGHHQLNQRQALLLSVMALSPAGAAVRAEVVITYLAARRDWYARRGGTRTEIDDDGTVTIVREFS